MRPITTAVAGVLEALVGPMVAAGMKTDLAVQVAKVQAWHKGDWDGDQCDQCPTKEPILHQRGTLLLCHRCDGIWAVYGQRQSHEERIRLAGQADA